MRKQKCICAVLIKYHIIEHLIQCGGITILVIVSSYWLANWVSTVDSHDLFESSHLVDAELNVAGPLTSMESSDLFMTEFDESGPVTSVNSSVPVSDGLDAVEPLTSMEFVVRLVDSLSLLTSVKLVLD